ncbi:MAG TPA: hypothetical protein VJ063_16670 [Verrucomicrobiae bacterium]|nr:hypothetical protein [Verrucomicrobiae bacterium]
MRWFYFVKSKKRVALWASHYSGPGDADQAFCDCVRLFYPVPTILYDRGFPFYSYYAYLAKTKQEEEAPEPTPHVRVQL